MGQSDSPEPVASDLFYAEPVDIFNTIDGADSALIRSEMAPLEGSQRQSAMGVARGLRREPNEEEIASVLGTPGADNSNDQGRAAASAGDENSGSNDAAASKAVA